MASVESPRVKPLGRLIFHPYLAWRGWGWGGVGLGGPLWTERKASGETEALAAILHPPALMSEVVKGQPILFQMFSELFVIAAELVTFCSRGTAGFRRNICQWHLPPRRMMAEWVPFLRPGAETEGSYSGSI